MTTAEKLIESGKASPELVAAYSKVVEMRQAVKDGEELPTKPPGFVAEHKENVKRGQTRERVRRFRERKKCNA